MSLKTKEEFPTFDGLKRTFTVLECDDVPVVPLGEIW